MSNLFIPSKIKVGFQKRTDTFTGNLAYVIYFDEKGVLRKESSWEGWRDKKIEAVEFENKPNAGYLLNKGVKRGGYHWGSGRSSIRIYDPRDFEFEITVDNLMGILMHSDVSKRDIAEECVLAWSGKDLVLLPVNSEEYQASVKYTEKQGLKLSAKQLVKGYAYDQKKSETPLIYIGYIDWFDWSNSDYKNYVHKANGKKHVFYDGSIKKFVTPAISSLAGVNSELVSSNYSNLVDDFFKTENSQPIVEIKIIQSTLDKSFSYGYLYRLCKNNIERVHVNLHNYHHNSSKFKTIDYNSQEITVENKDKKVMNISLIERANNRYYNHNCAPGIIEKSLNEKCKELGLDSSAIAGDDFIKVMKASNFGRISFILANGNVCKETKDF